MYRGYIRKWVKPRWDSFHLDEIKAVDVEGWQLKCSATVRELGPGP
jgi:hypothetical protein